MSRRFAGGLGSVRLGRLRLDGLSQQEMSEYFTYQYLVRARPAPAPDRGLTSIVIVTHNQLEYTRQCLDSIRRLTDEPYELIFVDNGSSDGTVGVPPLIPGVRLIANASQSRVSRRGQPGDIAAGGSQILLLNNDVIVTTGWLCRLLRALAQRSRDRAGGALLQFRQRSAAGRGRLRKPGRAGRVRLGLGRCQRRPGG